MELRSPIDVIEILIVQAQETDKIGEKLFPFGSKDSIVTSLLDGTYV